MAPQVSVVIPVYNRAATIGRAVASVLGQSFQDFELILVDDGSTDGTADAIRSFGDPRVRLVQHERNRGAAAARNTGVAAAAGDLIAFLDSDDAWHPGKLERQAAATLAMPGPAATCTGFRLRHPSGTAETRSVGNAADWSIAFLDGCYVSPGTTLMAKRQAFEAVGPLDVLLRRLEDWDWLLRLVRVGRFAVLPEILADVHLGPRPHPKAVREAAALLWSRHGDAIAASLGRRAAARFRASLMIEEFVCDLDHGAYVAALASGIGAALRSPDRMARFIATAAARCRSRMPDADRIRRDDRGRDAAAE